jgi:hypothetical protein
MDYVPRGTLATRMILHVANSQQRGSRSTWPQLAGGILPCGKLFLFFIFYFLQKKKKIKKKNPQKYHKIHFMQKYHKNIMTTFEIYHKHKIKLHKSIIISPTQQ